MAKEAIEGYLEVMHEEGLPVPTVERGLNTLMAMASKHDNMIVASSDVDAALATSTVRAAARGEGDPRR